MSHDDVDNEFRARIVRPEDGREVFQRAMAHARALIDNGETVMVRVGPALEAIDVLQRKFLHGPVLGQIAEQAIVADQRWTVDAWKEYFRRRFLGENGWRWEMQQLPGQKRATPRRIRISTEELGVRKYAEFTDRVIEYAVTELSVEFVFKPNEREETRSTRRPRQHAGEHQ